ncbi:MAG: aldehyde dehydrogenase family protein, partial [Planctomycetota bacterium]
MKMFLEGRWQSGSASLPVQNPFNGETIDEVPQGTARDIDRALTGLVEGARIMRKLSGYDRAQILRRVAVLMSEREPELARLISQEEGKVLSEGVLEASRAREVVEISAEE